jgi:amylosucrase
VHGQDWIPEQARKSLARLLPEIEERFANEIEQNAFDWHEFRNRLQGEWERLFGLLHDLYGWQYDFHYTLERVLRSMAHSFFERPAPMRELDRQRIAYPDWFQSEEMVGIVLYVDLFSDHIAKLAAHIDYFKQLGISLCVDFVFNHTSDEHAWSLLARGGDPDYMNFYYTFPDRELPDQFQRYLRDIFPGGAQGQLHLE